VPEKRKQEALTLKGDRFKTPAFQGESILRQPYSSLSNLPFHHSTIPKADGEEKHDFGPRHQTQTRDPTQYPHTPLNPVLLRLISQPNNPDQISAEDLQSRSIVRPPHYPLSHSTEYTNPLPSQESEIVIATNNIKVDTDIDPARLWSDFPPPTSKKGWKCPHRGCKYYSRLKEKMFSHWDVSDYSS
jgi:hypothetical protein